MIEKVNLTVTQGDGVPSIGRHELFVAVRIDGGRLLIRDDCPESGPTAHACAEGGRIGSVSR
jgi:hypothetical protein